jgi:hypothetical protein
VDGEEFEIAARRVVEAGPPIPDAKPPLIARSSKRSAGRLISRDSWYDINGPMEIRREH